MSVLEGEWQDEVSAALINAAVPYALTVTRTEYGPPPEPGEPGEEVTTNHSCLGWVDTYTQDLIDGTLIQTSDRRIMILANSLPIEPTMADTITAKGTTYVLASIKIDPAGVCWDIQARA